ncbi:MAG: lysine transporter LysE [Verrucomicrobiaceae bacterium]|nr:lysine transporter LysE [Verrucomicrobiaceae bacterium]
MKIIDLFASGFLLSLSLCLDIGIVNIALINTAVRSGMRSAMALGLGSCFGDLAYAALSLVGIGVLLKFAWVHELIAVVGIAVLLFLAWDAARSAWRTEAVAATAHQPIQKLSQRKLFIRGFVLSLASPTSILWFVAVGGSLIAQHNPQSSAGLFALFAGFFCGGLSWCLFITGLSARGGRALGDRFRRYCNAISTLLFLYFALRILFDFSWFH